MPGVLFEGGTFRSVFSCGVMDALLDEKIEFPYCIGVSAGSAYGVSYVSRQRGRNWRIIEHYRNDPRYVGKRNLLTDHSLFGVDFVFRTIPQELEPFDRRTFQDGHCKFVAVTTDAQTGKACYFTNEDVDDTYEVLLASCAMPLLLPPGKIGGREYFDGGLSNPIPIDKLLHDGQKKALVVLTQPEGFEKTCQGSQKLGALALRYRYPKVAHRILTRYHKYNESVKLCERLEQMGRVVIIRPQYPLASLEGDIKVLEASYRMGYRLAMEKMDEIRELFR